MGRVIKSQNVQYVNPAEQMSAKAASEVESSPPPPDPDFLERMQESIEARMKEKLEGQLQQATREAYAKGVSEGIQKGKDLERQDSLQALQSMQQIIGEAAALKEKIIADAEEQITALSLAIAEKILHAEVTTNGEVVKNVLKAAIRNLEDRENMKIRLHPLDFRVMKEIKNDFFQNFDGIKNVFFEQDEGIQRGGAVVETEFGEVDARIEQQLNEIKTAFQNPNIPEGG